MPDFEMPLVAATLIFTFAGAVKGLAGLGLPTVSMGLLGLLMAPAQAAALVIIPSLVTNVWQFAGGPYRWKVLRRTWPMLAAAAVTTWLGAGWLIEGGTGRAVAALGSVLVLYALIGLARIRIPAPGRAESWLSPLVGAATGLVTGATGVFVIPAAPYLHALGLEKDELVQALGLSFTVSTVALAAGLGSRGGFHLAAGGASLLFTVPALAGMVLGQRVRARVDPTTFRRVFFIGLLILGADLIARAAI